MTEGTANSVHTTQAMIREIGHNTCFETRHYLCVCILWGWGLEKQIQEIFEKNCNLPVKRAGVE